MSAFRAWQSAAQLEADAATFAERVRARLASRGAGVRRVDHSPEPIPADASGPLAAMVSAARRMHAAPVVELGVAAGSGRELLDEPCDTWVALPPELPSSRYVALRVVGDSMLPLLHSGDLVLLDLGAPVRVGMVAVASHPQHGYVVKLTARGGQGLALLSLNPAYPAIPFDPARGALLGPVVLRWCSHAPAKPRLAPPP
jgi:SOS-response transcriptional repressor LexA